MLAIVTALSALGSPASLDDHLNLLDAALSSATDMKHSERVADYTGMKAAAISRRAAVVQHQISLMADAADTELASTHGDKSKDYTRGFNDATADKSAAEKLCAACKAEEEKLIAALDDATTKHATAQTKDDAKSTAIAEHTAAETAWVTKKTEFSTKKGTITWPSITYDTDAMVFDDIKAAIASLKALAAQQIDLKSKMNAKKATRTQKEADYTAAAAKATAADTKVADTKAAQTSACKGLKGLATPVVSPSPSMP